MSVCDDDELRGVLDDLNRENERHAAEMASIRRRVMFLLGAPKPKFVDGPIPSPTGIKSKCVELAKQRRKKLGGQKGR